MHEMQVAQNIIDLALESVPSSSDTILKITVRVGGLNCIIGDSLNFYFDALSKEYEKLQNAVLEILRVPIVTLCPACGKTQTIQEPNFVCGCGSPLEIVSGEELQLDSITVG